MTTPEYADVGCIMSRMQFQISRGTLMSSICMHQQQVQSLRKMKFTTISLVCMFTATTRCADPGELLCQFSAFGNVNAYAADETKKALPFYDPKKDWQRAEKVAWRVFAEPVFFLPKKFSRLQNWGHNTIIQLPKIWKRRKCFMC